MFMDQEAISHLLASPGVKMTLGRERNRSREPRLYNANLLLQIKLLILIV